MGKQTQCFLLSNGETSGESQAETSGSMFGCFKCRQAHGKHRSGALNVEELELPSKHRP